MAPITLHLATVLLMASVTIAPAASDYLVIDLSFDCDNHDSATGAHEPILTYWSGDYQPGATEPVIVIGVEAPIGTSIGAIEVALLATRGFHDSWVLPAAVPETTVRVTIYINDIVYKQLDADCSPAPELAAVPVRVVRSGRVGSLVGWR